MAPIAGARNALARRRRFDSAAPLLAALAFYTVFILRSRVDAGGGIFTLFDDSMISMRYGHNLASGNGLVWNPGGAHVEGYSNFLWTLWMALLQKVPVPTADAALLVMISGAALLLGTSWMAGRIAAMLAPSWRPAQTVATTATAFCFPFVYWTLRGMEVGLIAFCIAASVLLLLRARNRDGGGAWWATLPLVPAMLARDDALILCVIVAAFAVATAPAPRRWRTLVVFGATIVLTEAGHELFRLLYYGDLLPNTYYLKVSGTPLSFKLGRGAAAIAVQLVCGLSVLAVLAGAHLARWRCVSGGARLLVALVAGQVAYSLAVGGDAWEEFLFADRYLATAMPMLCVLATLGLATLASSRTDWRRTRRALLTVSLTGMVLAAARLLPISAISAEPSQWRDIQLQAVVAAAVGLVLAAWLARTRRERPLTTAVYAVILVAPLSAVLGWQWTAHNAAYVATYDMAHVRYGLVLREATSESAVIAVAGAGAVPYFSDRPAIDLLGKNDPVVAHEQPRSLDVPPGHTKWDYAYSICRLQPDVVAELWHPTSPDRALLRDCGYTAIAGYDVYVRSNSTAVDPGRLRTLLDRLERDTAALGYLRAPAA